jgi:hypothetical protein
LPRGIEAEGAALVAGSTTRAAIMLGAVD